GRGAADAALELAGPEPVPEAGTGDGHLHQPQGAAVAVRQDGFRARLGDDLPPAPADLRQRLVPGDALPAPGTLRADPPQGVHQPVGVVDVLEVGPDLGAQPAAGDGTVGVAAEVDGPATLHLGEHGAGVGAVVGAGAADGQRGHGSYSGRGANATG